MSTAKKKIITSSLTAIMLVSSLGGLTVFAAEPSSSSENTVNQEADSTTLGTVYYCAAFEGHGLVSSIKSDDGNIDCILDVDSLTITGKNAENITVERTGYWTLKLTIPFKASTNKLYFTVLKAPKDAGFYTGCINETKEISREDILNPPVQESNQVYICPVLGSPITYGQFTLTNIVPDAKISVQFGNDIEVIDVSTQTVQDTANNPSTKIVDYDKENGKLTIQALITPDTDTKITATSEQYPDGPAKGSFINLSDEQFNETDNIVNMSLFFHNNSELKKFSVNDISYITTSVSYTGNDIEPIKFIKLKDGTILNENKDFTVSYGRTDKIGKVNADITLTGNYLVDTTGTNTFTHVFKIYPSKQKIQEIKGVENGFYIDYLNKNKSINGYEIRYSTDKDFKTYNRCFVNKMIDKKTIKNLQKNTTYYVKVRSYTNVSNEKWIKHTMYGYWSNTSTVNTK